jgi:hypothetical protein
MDGQQFDRLARALGSGNSRRALLKKFSAAGFGALLGSRVVERAAAQEVCLEVYSECPVVGEIGECCEGLQCTEFWNAPEGMGLCWWIPTCAFEEESCAELPCCDQMTCSEENVCIYPPAEYCADDEEFCGKDVERGVDVSCCEGYICNQQGEGTSCVRDMNYCVPVDGGCFPGRPVEEDPLCCAGLVCVETEGNAGICTVPDEPEKPQKPEEPKTPEIPVTRLPDTGAGQGTAGSEWVVPAAAGVAAAVLGGKIIQTMKATQDS